MGTRRCWKDSRNLSKILRTGWKKRDNMLEVQVPDPPDNQLLTKRVIVSFLASI